MHTSPQLPPYYIPRPPLDLNTDTTASFEALYRDAILKAAGAAIQYSLARPLWHFLCWVGDSKGVLFHGSGRSDIEEFEPRQANDVNEFGSRQAVYASDDPLWAMYFAVMDRDRYVRSLVNASFRASINGGPLSEPYYFFSINADALPNRPWRTATLYLLPADTFEREPSYRFGDLELHGAHWASSVPIRPVARIQVEPSDFPFLDQIRGHDPGEVAERARRNPAGFPWLDQ